MRATRIPAVTSERNTSSPALAGPSVQTIFVLAMPRKFGGREEKPFRFNRRESVGVDGVDVLGLVLPTRFPDQLGRQIDDIWVTVLP